MLLVVLRIANGLAGRIGDRETAADPFGKQVRDLHMRRNGLRMTRLWILPEGMLSALAPEHTAVASQVAKERVEFHPTPTSSQSAGDGKPRIVSSRR